MWIVFTVLGVFVGGTVGLTATVFHPNKRKRVKWRRRIRRGLGKFAVFGVNRQYARNRRKAANRAGWAAGLKAAFPWLVAAGRVGSSAFRDAKGDVLHPNQRIRTAGHAKSDKPGPWTKTTPKPGQSQGQGQPRQLERHSVTLRGRKAGSGQGQGGGSGHLCGARWKTDPKRTCERPVDCPDHTPDCARVIRCFQHPEKFGVSGGGPRPKPRPMPQGQPPKAWKVSDAGSWWGNVHGDPRRPK